MPQKRRPVGSPGICSAGMPRPNSSTRSRAGIPRSRSMYTIAMMRNGAAHGPGSERTIATPSPSTAIRTSDVAQMRMLTRKPAHTCGSDASIASASKNCRFTSGHVSDEVTTSAMPPRTIVVDVSAMRMGTQRSRALTRSATGGRGTARRAGGRAPDAARSDPSSSLTRGCTRCPRRAAGTPRPARRPHRQR